jgi:release factor glutamine methyltransferase
MGVSANTLLAAAVRRLDAAGVPEPAIDARRLLAHALAVDPGRLTLALAGAVPPEVAGSFETLVERRVSRVPLSHLTGRRAFWGRDFVVSAAVLDPRPETEVMIDAALQGSFSDVLDLGTGSGCILVTLLADRPTARGVGVDISRAALAVAVENARRHGVADRAMFACSDWFSAVGGTYDLIVANPPYIAAEEMAGLSPEVRDHEPRLALTDDSDGLSSYRTILRQARPYIRPGGRLMLEIGAGQGEAVTAIARGEGFADLRILPDLDGKDRVVVLEWQHSGR